jgi:hypothetical protein
MDALNDAFKLYYNGNYKKAKQEMIDICNQRADGYFDHLIAAELAYHEIPDAYFWAKQAIDRKCDLAIGTLAKCYYNGLGCTRNWAKVAQLYIDTNDMASIEYRMSCDNNYELLNDNFLMELYIYGRNNISYPHQKYNCIQIYTESTQRARSAALCFMFHFTIFPKDVRKIIARDIYSSRIYPAIWRNNLN